MKNGKHAEDLLPSSVFRNHAAGVFEAGPLGGDDTAGLRGEGEDRAFGPLSTYSYAQ